VILALELWYGYNSMTLLGTFELYVVCVLAKALRALRCVRRLWTNNGDFVI
jgi:hypothetical protein